MSSEHTPAIALQQELDTCQKLLEDFRRSEATGRLLDALVAAAQAGVTFDENHLNRLTAMHRFCRECWPTELWPAQLKT